MNRSALTILITILLCLGAFSQAVAQDPYAYVTSDSITVGDRFGLVIVVPRPSDAYLARPIFRAPTGASTIRYGDLIIFKSQSSGQKSLPVGADLPVADTLVYEAATFAVDTAFVPPLRLTLVQRSDSTRVATSGFEFPVVSLVDESMEDILDLSDLASFPPALWPWILLATILIASFLLIKYKDRFKRETEPEPQEEPEIIPDPPFEEASKRFDRLEGREFDPENVKLYFVELTDIIRVYFARRIDIPALESTSSELLHDLTKWTQEQNYDQPFGDRLGDILATADLAKFADSHPAEQLCADAVAQSRKLVSEIEDLVVLKAKQALLRQRDGADDSNDDDEADSELDGDLVENDVNGTIKPSEKGNQQHDEIGQSETHGSPHEDSVATDSSSDSSNGESDDDWERFKPAPNDIS